MASEHKSALVTEIPGQDGTYLANLLPNKAAIDLSLHERGSIHTSWRLHPLRTEEELISIDGDLTDLTAMLHTMEKAIRGWPAQTQLGTLITMKVDADMARVGKA